MDGFCQITLWLVVGLNLGLSVLSFLAEINKRYNNVTLKNYLTHEIPPQTKSCAGVRQRGTPN
jgi:hypothetical protein